MQNFVPSDYAGDMILKLKSRFHPGKPHLSTLGPLPPEQETDDLSLNEPDGEDEVEEVSSGMIKEGITFQFVPNRASYRITVDDQKNSSISKISFYLRISEGCEEDLTAEDGRPTEYVISREQLEKSFRRYDIIIDSDITTGNHDVNLWIDEKKINLLSNEYIDKIKIHKRQDDSIEIRITDKSDPFLTRFSERKFQLEKQDYIISINKKITTIDNGEKAIDVKVVNLSPLTNESIHPIRYKPDEDKPGWENKPESEEKCLENLKNGDLRESALFAQWSPKFFQVNDASWAIGGNNYGRLMEFTMSEENIDTKTRPYHGKHGKDLENVINIVYDDSQIQEINGRFVGTISYHDHLIFKEKIPPMTKGSSPTDLFSRIGFSKILAETLEQKKYERLKKFQEDGIITIDNAIKENVDNAVLISARTGSGKTEAFMIPILNYCIQKIEEGGNDSGVKALIFYPTKALANDQASRIIGLLYQVNKFLKRKITIGLLHGDIPKGEEDPKYQESQMEGVPFACPKCNDGTLVPKSIREVYCRDCGEELDFVFALTREPIYSEAPDIIITNPDTIQFDMMLKPSHHGIFGREIQACADCSATFSSINKRSCDYCKKKNLKKILPHPPRFIVLDEIHMFSGTFGINTSYLLSRLRSLIKKYGKEYHGMTNQAITLIGSSATISNAGDFTQVFFDLEPSLIRQVPMDDKIRESYYLDEQEEELHRLHVFIMPYAFRPMATVAKAVGYLQSRRINGEPPLPFLENRETSETPLQVLGFVNNLSDSTSLIDITEREFPHSMDFIKVSGHTTDFDKSQRSGAEKKFNKSELHVIYATPTLEVGVDFRKVDCVIIFGFPFSFNEYVQRIGRGGRTGPTLVLTVCLPWKPIDHYFYSDARKKIKEQHKNLEPIPITRNNPDAIQKHLRSSIFEILASWKDSENMFDDLRELSTEFSALKEKIIEESMSNLSLTQEQMESGLSSINSFVKELETEFKKFSDLNQKMSMGKKFFDPVSGFSDKYRLTDLRSTEPPVAVEIFWEAMS